MYTVAVRRDFIAQHYLIGGDWGAENELHSHHYQAEVQLEGAELELEVVGAGGFRDRALQGLFASGEIAFEKVLFNERRCLLSGLGG